MTAGSRFFDDVRDDTESVPLEKRTIFGRVEASVVKRFALKRSDGFPVYRAAGEHEGRVWSGMGFKNREHLRLIFRAEVEKTVPCQDALKTPAEKECSHVVDDPVLIGEAGFADVDESRRGVHAGHTVAAFDEVARNGLGRTAADIEDGSPQGHKSQKPVEPGFFEKMASSEAVPIGSVALI